MLGKAVMMTKGSEGLAGDYFFTVDMSGNRCLLGVVLAARPLWEAWVFFGP